MSRVCFVVGTSDLAVDIRGGLGCGDLTVWSGAPRDFYVFFYYRFVIHLGVEQQKYSKETILVKMPRVLVVRPSY